MKSSSDSGYLLLEDRSSNHDDMLFIRQRLTFLKKSKQVAA